MTETVSAPVSVVIPCYRCADTICRAVSSVYTQAWRPAEVILVDDHSGDGTLSRLYELEREYPDDWIRVIPLSKNGGPGTARNEGWEQATQQYVAFLDADDAWHPLKVDMQARWMLANPDASLTGHASMVISTEYNFGSGLYGKDDVKFSLVSSRQLLASNQFPTRSVMLKRNLPHRFAPGKRYIEDFLLWCETCLDGYQCFRSDVPLAFTFKEDYGERGLSSNLWRMEKGELDVYRVLFLTKRISASSFLFHAFYSILKYIRREVIVLARGKVEL